MDWSDVLFWLPLALSIPFAAGMALAFRRKVPSWSRNKVALMAALPGCISVLLLGFWAYVHETSQPSDVADGGEAFFFLYMFLTSAYTVMVFAVGAIAARICLSRGPA